nr:MAG TPA: hypothetical protein [Caudoviricetes sp.]
MLSILHQQCLTVFLSTYLADLLPSMLFVSVSFLQQLNI